MTQSGVIWNEKLCARKQARIVVESLQARVPHHVLAAKVEAEAVGEQTCIAVPGLVAEKIALDTVDVEPTEIPIAMDLGVLQPWRVKSI